MNKVLHRSKGRSRKKGSTLIEVLISIAVVVLVLITIVAGGTLVTKNRRFSSDQALSTKYSQEVAEWAKNMRNTMGWKAFYDTVTAKGSPAIVCLPTLPATPLEFDGLSPGACADDDVIVDTQYRRAVQFAVLSPSEIAVTGLVDWTDNDQDHQTRAEAILQEWQ